MPLVGRRDQTGCPTPLADGQATRPAKRPVAWAAAVVAVVGLLGACDTGDGKTLPDPTGTVAPPTVPPPTTALPGDVDGTLASLPLESPVSDSDALPPTSPSPFGIVAPWLDGGSIDPINTCDGDNLSPAMSWTGVPDGTIELAVALVDESIDNGPPFIHWVLAGLNPADISVIEGSTPLGAIQGLNFFGNIGYDGPCPPPGDPAHVYRLTIYALNQQVELADGTPATDLLNFVQTVAVASSDVTGTYVR